MKTSIISRFTDTENVTTPIAWADFQGATIQYEISHHEIENRLTSRLAHDLRVDPKNPLVIAGPGSIVFSVNGYDDDQRELYQIPKFVRFIRRVNKAAPCWLYFAVPESNWLQVVACSVLRSSRVHRSRSDKKILGFSTAELAHFLDSQVENFYQLSTVANVDKRKAEEHLQSVLGIFGIKYP